MMLRFDRFMTAAAVGPITALCFKATIDDPTRFKRSRNVGAYIGLTTRRHASGEIDWSGQSQSAVAPCCACICSRRPACC